MACGVPCEWGLGTVAFVWVLEPDADFVCGWHDEYALAARVHRFHFAGKNRSSRKTGKKHSRRGASDFGSDAAGTTRARLTG